MQGGRTLLRQSKAYTLQATRPSPLERLRRDRCLWQGVSITLDQAHARRVIGGERVPRAHWAGAWAAARARGEIKSVPASPALVGLRSEENVFVLIRSLPDLGLRGLAPFRYPQLRGYVEGDGVVSPSRILHGFFSVAEALEYWQAVCYDLPWPLLLPRP